MTAIAGHFWCAPEHGTVTQEPLSEASPPCGVPVADLRSVPVAIMPRAKVNKEDRIAVEARKSWITSA
jgi:hypothetical protein